MTALNKFPGVAGSQNIRYDFNFKYIWKEHVRAYIENNATKARTDIPLRDSNWVGPYSLNLQAVPVGSSMVIRRITPTDPLVDFVVGSRFSHYAMNVVARQGLYVAEEAKVGDGETLPQAAITWNDLVGVPTAARDRLGVMRPGFGLAVAQDGTVSVDAAVVAAATAPDLTPYAKLHGAGAAGLDDQVWTGAHDLSACRYVVVKDVDEVPPTTFPADFPPEFFEQQAMNWRSTRWLAAKVNENKVSAFGRDSDVPRAGATDAQTLATHYNWHRFAGIKNATTGLWDGGVMVPTRDPGDNTANAASTAFTIREITTRIAAIPAGPAEVITPAQLDARLAFYMKLVPGLGTAGDSQTLSGTNVFVNYLRYTGDTTLESANDYDVVNKKSLLAFFAARGGTGGGGTVGPSSYVLPIATTQTLGGVRGGGAGVSISSDGIISFTGTTPTGGGDSNYVLPEASNSVLGGIRVSNTPADSATYGTVVDSNGVLYGRIADVDSTSFNVGPVYGTGSQIHLANRGMLALKPATATTLGGVKSTGRLAEGDNTPGGAPPGTPTGIASGILVTEEGYMYGPFFQANTAHFWTSTMQSPDTGNQIVGRGVLNLKPATTQTLGGVQPDGTTITITSRGTISAVAQEDNYVLPVSGNTTLGGVMVDGYTAPAADHAIARGMITSATGLLLGPIDSYNRNHFDTAPIIRDNVTYYGRGLLSLKPATATTLGGVIVEAGSGLTIDVNGKLVAEAQRYILPAATATTRGGVTLGTGMGVDGAGRLEHFIRSYGYGLDLTTEGEISASSELANTVGGADRLSPQQFVNWHYFSSIYTPPPQGSPPGTLGTYDGGLTVPMGQLNSNTNLVTNERWVNRRIADAELAVSQGGDPSKIPLTGAATMSGIFSFTGADVRVETPASDALETKAINIAFFDREVVRRTGNFLSRAGGDAVDGATFNFSRGSAFRVPTADQVSTTLTPAQREGAVSVGWFIDNLDVYRNRYLVPLNGMYDQAPGGGWVRRGTASGIMDWRGAESYVSDPGTASGPGFPLGHYATNVGWVTERFLARAGNVQADDGVTYLPITGHFDFRAYDSNNESQYRFHPPKPQTGDYVVGGVTRAYFKEQCPTIDYLQQLYLPINGNVLGRASGQVRVADIGTMDMRTNPVYVSSIAGGTASHLEPTPLDLAASRQDVQAVADFCIPRTGNSGGSGVLPSFDIGPLDLRDSYVFVRSDDGPDDPAFVAAHPPRNVINRTPDMLDVSASRYDIAAVRWDMEHLPTGGNLVVQQAPNNRTVVKNTRYVVSRQVTLTVPSSGWNVGDRWGFHMIAAVTSCGVDFNGIPVRGIPTTAGDPIIYPNGKGCTYFYSGPTYGFMREGTE